MTEPNIVMRIVIGRTRIAFADNYCRDKTEADVKRILNEVARKAQRALSAEAVMNGDA